MEIWNQIQIFVVIMARMSSFIFVMPVLGNRMVPLPVKVGLSVFLSVFLISALGAPGENLPSALMPFMLIVIKEVLIGLTLGFITKFIFAGVQIAGDLVGRQMGFALANVMDPSFQGQISVIGEFQVTVTFLIYLGINGHHFLIQGLMQSYQQMPITGGLWERGIGLHIVRMASSMFETGIKIASPVVVALLLTSVALGILARTVPQMNIFMVGLPLRVGIGLVTIMTTLGVFIHIFMRMWNQFRFDFMAVLRF